MITNMTLIFGYILDLIFGDPYSFPHPVKFIGKLISYLEHNFFNSKVNKFLSGIITFFIVVFSTYFITLFILNTSYKIDEHFGIAIESFLVYTILSSKCLCDEAIKIYKIVKSGDINSSRIALSYIVGRQTDKLTFSEIIKAVIETVAENTVDGVLTPIFFLVIGGTPLAMAFKAISTLDSMIGYKNEKYEYFGKFSARMDDIFNLLPARLSVIFFIFSSMITGLDTKNCVRICMRDRKNHLSPNCAYPESLVAGALNIQLGGNHYYSGKLVEKPTIGDDIKSVDEDDIMKTVNLLRISTFMAILLAYYISDKYLSI